MSLQLSVIMPAYNEEEAIEDAVREVVVDVLDRVDASELIVVNDGSTDATGERLAALAAGEPRLRVLDKPNGGHGSAVLHGLECSDATWVFLVDSDMQMPMRSFAQLWSAVEAGADAAFGVRRRRHDPGVRLWLTRLVRGAVQWMFGVSLYDSNVPYKLVRRSDWLELRPLIPSDTLAPSLFLAVALARRGRAIAEIDVPHKERSTGVPSLRIGRLFTFCRRAFAQLLRFRRELA